MKLHSYFRSSASFRVRIALALKGLAYDYVPVHLVRREQLAPGFAALSRGKLVPVLEDDNARVLTQSMAIIEDLDETCPQPPLLPADAPGRARVRAIAQDIACRRRSQKNQVLTSRDRQNSATFIEVGSACRRRSKTGQFRR